MRRRAWRAWTCRAPSCRSSSSWPAVVVPVDDAGGRRGDGRRRSRRVDGSSDASGSSRTLGRLDRDGRRRRAWPSRLGGSGLVLAPVVVAPVGRGRSSRRAAGRTDPWPAGGGSPGSPSRPSSPSRPARSPTASPPRSAVLRLCARLGSRVGGGGRRGGRRVGSGGRVARAADLVGDEAGRRAVRRRDRRRAAAVHDPRHLEGEDGDEQHGEDDQQDDPLALRRSGRDRPWSGPTTW